MMQPQVPNLSRSRAAGVEHSHHEEGLALADPFRHRQKGPQIRAYLLFTEFAVCRSPVGPRWLHTVALPSTRTQKTSYKSVCQPSCETRSSAAPYAKFCVVVVPVARR